MKNTNRRMILYVGYIVLGIVLIVLSAKEIIDDFFTGFGGGFIGVGIVMLIKAIRYNKNPEYKEKIDTENNDERNRYLSMKAWSWTGYLFVLVMACATIVSAILSQMLYVRIFSLMLTLVCLLYFISYLIVRKKY